MFDHLGFHVSDLTRSRGFYDACLGAVGIRLLEDHSTGPGGGWLVYGTADDKPFLVVAGGRPSFWESDHGGAISPIHVAFEAPDRSAVDAFFSAGLANGGRSNGEPGERDSTTPYYAAYLIDPDGNNVEAGVRESKNPVTGADP